MYGANYYGHSYYGQGYADNQVAIFRVLNGITAAISGFFRITRRLA